MAPAEEAARARCYVRIRAKERRCSAQQAAGTRRQRRQAGVIGRAGRQAENQEAGARRQRQAGAGGGKAARGVERQDKAGSNPPPFPADPQIGSGSAETEAVVCLRRQACRRQVRR